MKTTSILAFFFLGLFKVQAQLAVNVSPPKIVAQKAVVQLAMTNRLSEKIESARAVCFLLDEQGRMAVESSEWVIGGTKSRPALKPKTGTAFNFVINSPRPFASTNLTVKLSFSSVRLENGQIPDVNKAVIVTTP